MQCQSESATVNKHQRNKPHERTDIFVIPEQDNPIRNLATMGHIHIYRSTCLQAYMPVLGVCGGGGSGDDVH
jgi:hypothetical protein